jgi:Ca2+/Na+ antiporter
MSDELFVKLVVGGAILLFILLIVLYIWYSIYQNRKEKEKERARQSEIMAHESEWGSGICAALIARQVGIAMTEDMVLLSWGKPSNIDQEEITKSGLNKIRWVYGQPRRGANYVWFTNGKVSKIKTG